jgi:hypothetical protein
MKYHYIHAEFVMRDCKSIEDAIKQFERLMPQHPDESAIHMESWAVLTVHDPVTGESREIEI